jgi:imidazolonepropionase-like amidohydrolase
MGRVAWSPEEMKFADAPPFIKFALGENVKQSNWGDHNVIRFPQSRMGVEQVFADHFTRAAAYRKLRATDAKGGQKTVVRRDLNLEALAEILEGKRYITCHSYVQSEVNMLMKLSDSLGFRVNTFTHILEGYKVADKIKTRGIYASTFSDWWAYKNEVMEAIPYNAALMTKAGIVTAINSDDAEMARRLNQEAAKTVKYGGLTPVQALKLVTLNPAKMLHIDKQVGSIAAGKSADVVIWSGHPLSVYSVAEQTIVDGVVYFDRKRDAELQRATEAERARIIARLLKAKRAGEPAVKPAVKKQKLYHCDTMEGEGHE